MEKGCRAILKHYSSTLKKPQHEDCPTGKESWCKYQLDIANGTSNYKPAKYPIPPAIQKLVKPIFDKLGNKAFLECCKKISSSNPNEAFHNVLWGLAPKERFCSPQELKLAVWISVCHYNSGFTWTYINLLNEMGIEITKSMMQVFRAIDKERIYKSDYHFSYETKVKRRVKRREKNKLADAFQKEKDYKSGAFHGTSSKRTRKDTSKRK